MFLGVDCLSKISQDYIYTGWISVVVIAMESLRGTREHFWNAEELTVTIMLNYLQSDVRKKKNENLELSRHLTSNLMYFTGTLTEAASTQTVR